MKKLFSLTLLLFAALMAAQTGTTGGIQTVTNFKVGYPAPADDRQSATSTANLAGIHDKYHGLTTSVTGETLPYVYNAATGLWTRLDVLIQGALPGYLQLTGGTLTGDMRVQYANRNITYGNQNIQQVNTTTGFSTTLGFPANPTGNYTVNIPTLTQNETLAFTSYADAKVLNSLATPSTTAAPSVTAVNTALADKITIDDVYPLLGDSERVESTPVALTNIEDYLDATAKGTGTAYHNGKNFYNTVWASGSNTTLISQSLDKYDVNVTAGTFRSSSAVSKVFPVGTFTASVEITILTGSTTVVPIVYVYRTGQSGSPNAITTTLSGGKYIGHVTFTNTAETTITMVVNHSIGSATTAHTAQVAMQIEYGTTNTYLAPFNGGGTITLTSSEYPIPDSSIYIYATSTSSLTLTRTRFTLGNLNKVVDCWGDSLTEGTGSTTGKPGSDTNTDVSYPAQLGRMIPTFTVRNLGVGGETSWMIAARQGGMGLKVEPFVLPADTTPVRVYLSGIEQDYYYTAGAWTYLDNNLSYNIALGTGKGVNPVTINGIEGTLTRTLLSAGTPDPTTGETVASATYAYYFARSVSGTSITTRSPKEVVTLAKSEYTNDIMVIWMGQNDAPEHSGSYPLQKGSYTRARRMVEACKQANRRYIIINAPAGSNTGNAAIDQEYALEFGSNFLNIRDFICRYGVGIAAAAGYAVADSTDNTYIGSSTIDGTYATVGASHAAGVIARNFRIDGVHGNYWYYYIVAVAVNEKGKDLGYW